MNNKNEIYTELKNRDGMTVCVSFDNHDNGIEFVRLEFQSFEDDEENRGGYVQLELDNRGISIETYDAKGDVLFDPVFYSYKKFKPEGK